MYTYHTFFVLSFIVLNATLSTRTQEITKDASPADYGNEELYQEMEKVYFVVSDKEIFSAYLVH